MTHTRNPAASDSVCVCVCLFGCATGQQVAHNVKTAQNNSNGNNMGKGNGDGDGNCNCNGNGNSNGSCLLRPGRKTMPGNEVHTCTHTCALACDMTSACFCILQQLTFAFIRSAAHVCVCVCASMCIALRECSQAVRLSIGVRVQVPARLQYVSGCLLLRQFYAICTDWQPLLPRATTSCLRAKLAR